MSLKSWHEAPSQQFPYYPRLCGWTYNNLCYKKIWRLEFPKSRALIIHFAKRACRTTSGSTKLRLPYSLLTIQSSQLTQILAFFSEPFQRQLFNLALTCQTIGVEPLHIAKKYHIIDNKTKLTTISLVVDKRNQSTNIEVSE